MATNGCRQGCLEAFNSSNFGLDHHNPELFVTPQWRAKSSVSRTVYVFYRSVVALFWFVMLVLSGVTDVGWYSPSVDGWKWFIYLTNWALLVLTADVIIQAITSAYALVRGNQWKRFDSELQMVWYLKTQWVLSNISLCAGIFVTIASAVLFYSAELNLHYLDVVSHLINSIYLFVNLFISAMPVRVYHAVHTSAFFLAYILFSIVVQNKANAVAYYGVLMDDPKTLAMAIFLGAILTTVALWLFIYGLFRIRLTIAGATARFDNSGEEHIYKEHYVDNVFVLT